MSQQTYKIPKDWGTSQKLTPKENIYNAKIEKDNSTRNMDFKQVFETIYLYPSLCLY